MTTVYSNVLHEMNEYHHNSVSFEEVYFYDIMYVFPNHIPSRLYKLPD